MFSASRLLSNSRHLIRKNAMPCKKVGESWRGCHVVAAPPKQKVPKSELYSMGLLLFVTMWAYPAWIIYHIPDYQQEDRNTYTGK